MRSSQELNLADCLYLGFVERMILNESRRDKNQESVDITWSASEEIDP